MGHFICLADEFLKDGGVYGAVANQCSSWAGK